MAGVDGAQPQVTQVVHIVNGTCKLDSDLEVDL